MTQTQQNKNQPCGWECDYKTVLHDLVLGLQGPINHKKKQRSPWNKHHFNLSTIVTQDKQTQF